MSELVSEVVGEQVSMETPLERLRALLNAHKLPYEKEWGVGRLIFTLYDELVEQTLVNPTFVCDYPVEVSPLAKRKPEDPRLTERFELVVAGHEYANAFTELNDPVDQEARFQAQVDAKAAGDDEAMEYDYDYVRALEYGMPPTGGVGYGIDRMVMLFCDEPSIRDVLLFPHMRPEALGAGSKKQQQAEALMCYFAKQYDPANEAFWGIVGLLHDLDWEVCGDDAQHTVKAAELLAEAGANPALAHCIQTHNYDINPELPEPSHKMECVLFAVDELSGLINACVRMRPSHSVMDFELKSLKKKFKNKSFAAGCDREVIKKGAELMGMELDELFSAVIAAEKELAGTTECFE